MSSQASCVDNSKEMVKNIQWLGNSYNPFWVCIYRNGDLKCLTDMGSKDSGGWLSWGFKKLVQEPVGWSLRKMAWQQTTTTSNESEETYVVLEVIKVSLLSYVCASEFIQCCQSIIKKSCYTKI